MISNSQFCTGCGACAQVCVKNAINFEKDEKGFLVPQIDKEKCITCNRCEKVCQQNQTVESRKPIANFIGRLMDSEKLLESQSGGIFYSLAIAIIEKKGIVYGAAMLEDQTVTHIRVENVIDLEKLQKSKYVQSNCLLALKQIRDDLQRGRIVLFSGTPCQCAAVDLLYSRRKYPKLFLCDLICHGVPSPGVWESFLEYIEEGYHSKIVKAIIRDKKKYGWNSYVSTFTFKNQKRKKTRIFTTLFDDNYIIRPSCFLCKYTKLERVGDITLGDAWGINKIKTLLPLDDRGMSLCLVNTLNGLRLFNFAKEHIIFERLTDDRLIHEQKNLNVPSALPENYKVFWRDYSTRPFREIASRYGGNAFLTRIKYFIKYSVLKKMGKYKD